MTDNKEKPQPPSPTECCESGCDPCVWDVYRDELQKWNDEQDRLKKAKKPEL